MGKTGKTGNDTKSGSNAVGNQPGCMPKDVIIAKRTANDRERAA